MSQEQDLEKGRAGILVQLTDEGILFQEVKQNSAFGWKAESLGPSHLPTPNQVCH